MTAFIGTKTADIHIEHVIETVTAIKIDTSTEQIVTNPVAGSFLPAVMHHFQYLLTDYGFQVKTVDLSRRPPEAEERVEFESAATRVSVVNNQRSVEVIIYRTRDDRYRYFLHLLQICEYHLLSEAAKKVTCSLDAQDKTEAEMLQQAAMSRRLRLPSESAFEHLNSQLIEYSRWLREYARPFLMGDFTRWLEIYEYMVSSSRAAHIRSGKDEFARSISKTKMTADQCFSTNSIT